MPSFDWRSRLTWIGRTDSGVVRQRLYDRQIRVLLLSPLDPGRKAWDEAIRKETATPGRYIDPHWFGLAGDGHALEFRQKCDQACAELQPGEPLMIDLEQVSMDYVRRLFNGSPGNRGLVNSGRVGFGGTQQDRPIAYTNEPFKNHTVVPMEIFSDCPDLNWYYQRYYGDMSPADGDAICLEILRDYEAWVSHDDLSGRLHPFYDGKLIASDQRDGAWFTAERIPGVFAPTLAAMRTLAEHKRSVEMSKGSLREHYSHLAAAA